MKEKMKEMKIGELIGVDGAAGFNHGCMDYAVLEYLGDGKAKVVEAESCHSCWQVGHGEDHVFARVGDVYDISSCTVSPATDWPAKVKYELDSLGWLLTW